ncbi:MAG: asparagine synthase (glutamine-hydrolyzing) [Candidatus Hydrogenedentes bacterium]|nr:asparagine synthase (glutamine-hydrolyzing) [Candidatus Hydrogenedentota bacterium]
MCGIFGFIGHSLSEAQIERAIRAMHHRGPDGQGMFVDEAAGIGLGHARLSIIDLSTGAQPLYSETGDIVLVCNGEIYDFERIREELIALGHVFSTRSDSEVIIHLYQEHGANFVHHLRGEFAFLLYDASKRKLLAVRDRFGIKPLFYNVQDGKFLFGSETKALFASGALRPEIDVVGVRDYLCGAIPDSIFAGVQAVPPGHVLTMELDTRTHSLFQYWDLDLPMNESIPLNGAQYPRVVRDAFDEAVRLRMRADVPVGVYLSGGIDSAIVAATVARHFSGKLKVFTIAFPEEKAYNEIAIAEKMAEKIGAEFHSVPCDQETLLRNTEDCLWITEMPFPNLHGVGKFILSRLAREHVTVVLTGEGSDELFLGYVYFQSGKGAMSDQMGNRLRDRKHPSHRSMRGVIDALGFVPLPEHGQTLTDTYQRFLARLFHRDHQEAVRATHPLDRLKRRINRAQTDGHTHARKVQYFWIKSMLAPYLLSMLGDRAEMSHSIEGRTPFLDHHLFETVRRIPDSEKICNGIEKHVLREAFKEDLTEELYKRAKWPYSAPPLRVAKGQSAVLDHLIDTYLSPAAIRRSGIFSSRTIRILRFMAHALPRASQFGRNVNTALLFILTVQILERSYVQEFDANLARRACPERASVPA